MLVVVVMHLMVMAMRPKGVGRRAATSAVARRKRMTARGRGWRRWRRWWGCGHRVRARSSFRGGRRRVGWGVGLPRLRVGINAAVSHLGVFVRRCYRKKRDAKVVIWRFFCIWIEIKEDDGLEDILVPRS